MNRSRELPIHLTLATFLGTAFLSLLLLNGTGPVGAESADSARVLQVKQGTDPPTREGPLGGYARVVESVKPSVVSILSWTAKNAAGQTPPLGGDSEISGGAPEPPAPGTLPGHPKLNPALMGVGSGVILSEQGHVLTNHHVVADARWIWVMLPDSSERLNARVLGQDADTDLAVLKIDTPGVRPATFGDSDLMKAGDVVLAIGNPFGLSQTVTYGIVSATSRSDLDIAGLENFIQTDASINPGNSGGALINTNGEVIGINTAIYSRNGGSVGVGFSISSNLALKIAKKLVEKGEVARGYLGLAVSALTPDLAQIFRVDGRGALVNEVTPNSPSERAGCRPGDVVVSINEKAVASPAEFRLAVADLEPGSKAVITVVREGKPQQLHAHVSRPPEGIEAVIEHLQKLPPTNTPQLFTEGILIEELTPALRLEHGIPAHIKGVLITQIQPNVVLESGLRPGTVICEVARRAVDSVPKALETCTAASSQARNALLLRVWVSGKGFQFAAVKLHK